MENLNPNDSGTASAASPALIEEREADRLPELRTAIGGRFEIIEPLGASEIYTLFLARDGGGKLIRLKVLSAIAALDPTKIELFYLEAFAASRLSHPNIARASEPEYLANVHFCTGEHYSNAVTLRSLLDRRGWLPAEFAASVAGQIADALEHAHAKGVLHLNLHPGNVLIGTDGRVIVTGFGIGSNDEFAWARQKRSRQLPPQYLSPEQAQEQHLDHMSDLYSLGVLLFEMLTDRVPFDSSDPDVIKQRHISQSPQAPQVFRAGLSALPSALVLSLLEKSPDKRCGNTTQLRSVLTSLAGSARIKQPVDVSAPLETTPDEQPAELTGISRDPFYEETDALPARAEEDEIKERPGNSIESAASETAASEAAASEAALFQREPARATKREAFEPPTITVMDSPPLNSETANAASSSREVAHHRDDAQMRLTSEETDRSAWRLAALVLISAVIAVGMSIFLARGNHLSNFFRKAPPAETGQAPSDSALKPEINTPAPAQAVEENKDSGAGKDVAVAGRNQLWRTQPVAKLQSGRAKKPIYRSKAGRQNQQSKQKLRSIRSRWLRLYRQR